MPYNTPINVSEVGIEVPKYADVEQWRIGKPSDKLGVTIFLRIVRGIHNIGCASFNTSV